MIKAVLLTLCVIFACLGICDFVHAVKSALSLPKIKPKRYCVFFLNSGCAAEQLRFISDKHRWYGSEYCDELVGMVDDLSDVEAASLESFCYGGNVHLCRFENIIEQLNFLETGEFDEGQYDT